MPALRQTLGRWGEDLAVHHLEQLGYEIVERNYRRPGGEIDIVAREGERWAFVEVRTRRGNAFGEPEESVTQRKQARLAATARLYLQEHDCGDVDWGIDVVAITIGRHGRLERILVNRNAVWDV